MDIPLIAQITEFPTTSSSLITSANRFLKWGPLFLAFIYAVARFSRTIHISLLHLHWRSSNQSFSSSSPLLNADGEFFTSDDEDEDEVSSSSSSSDDEDDDPASISYENLAGFYDDSPVKGSGKNRRFKIRRKRSVNGVNMFALGDLVNGEGVVKFWDGLGLGIDGSSVSILDMERNVRIGVLPGRIPAVTRSSAVVLTAGGGGDGRVGVSSWDVRVRRRTPAVKAEWSLTAAGLPVSVEAGGVEKVYVRDGVTRNGRVWDVRNVKSPLEDVTGCDGERWWDGNAVSEMEEE